MTQQISRPASEPSSETIVTADFNVWEGVYASFAEAPAIGPGFDGPVWRERSIQAARQAAAQVQGRQPLDYALRQRNAVLPPVVATMLTQQSRVSILDFGGGLGTGYFVLTGTIPEAAGRLDYSIVDVDGIAVAGRQLFDGKQGPTFQSELPGAARFDIVHASSVFQYIDDWRSLLARLARHNARFLILADMFVGDFESFVTLQNYYGSKIRHWFLNIREFLAEVERNGYKLALRVDCDAKIAGRYGPLPMGNFPSSLRLSNTSSFLFRCSNRA
jgi:putative methyltransferase (TIGR04325 family)